MRSLSTSFVALMPVLSLLIVGTGVFGAKSLEDFALALAAGLFIGSYSSIFVAAPILAWWKEREPQYRALAERRARLGPTQPLVAAAAASSTAKVPVASGAIVSSAAVDTNGGDTAKPDKPEKYGGVPGGPPPMPRRIEPRARQQRRRKRK
jgi:preprotein translocase subunit SecF